LDEADNDDAKIKIIAIIIDPTLPCAMGQILVQPFDNWKTRDVLLGNDITVMAISVDEDK